MRISRGEERGTERVSEAIMTENVHKWMLHTKLQVQEAQKSPSRINAPKTIP